MKGYCGCASIQSAALYYGNWLSQGQIYIIGGNTSDALLDVNAADAATALHLVVDKWDIKAHKTPQSKAFLAWAKQHLDSGVPVLLGAYESEPSGDKDYDHIVLAMGYQSAAGVLTSLSFNDWCAPICRLHYFDSLQLHSLYSNSPSHVQVCQRASFV